jgi:hypothetical protein
VFPLSWIPWSWSGASFVAQVWSCSCKMFGSTFCTVIGTVCWCSTQFKLFWRKTSKATCSPDTECHSLRCWLHNL